MSANPALPVGHAATAAPAIDALRAPLPASTHVPHIDGLRAIAVLAVIVYHLKETWLPGGFAGVDVFFAISGFVVSASVGNWNRGGFGAFLGYFYARRMQRIAPALIVCLLLVGIASTMFIPLAWLSNANEQTGLYAFFGLSNWYLANHRESYFSPTVEFNPYTHTWSLGVEEQFYLLFPLLFFAWTRGGRWRQVSVALFALAMLVSIAWASRLGRSDHAAAFYLITTRLWELAAGVLLYQVLALAGRGQTTPSHPTTWWSRTGALLSLGLMAAGLLFSAPRSFPYPGAFLPVLGTLGLIGFLHGRRRGPLAAALGSSPMAYIGRISYSLYLWHWPVFVLLRWTFGLESTASRIGGVAATFVLAAASYHLVERPLRYAPMLRRWPRAAVVAAGLLVIVGGWWLSPQIVASRHLLAQTTVTRHAADWYPHAALSVPDVPGCRLEQRAAAAGTGSLVVYTRAGCPAPDRLPPTIFVIGDSHATAYARLLSEHVLRTGASVVLYHNPSCTFVSLQPLREGGICPAQAKAAVADMLARSRPGDVVFLAALRLTRFSHQFAAVDEDAARKSMLGKPAMEMRRHAEDDAIALLQPLADRGLHLVLEAPKPVLRAPPFRCADWFNAGNPICRPGLTITREDIERYRSPVLDSFARMTARMPALGIWDPLPILCPAAVCEASMDGRPLYFDGDHLSAYGNRVLMADFERHLGALATELPMADARDHSPHLSN